MYCWLMEHVSGDAKSLLGPLPEINFSIMGLVVAGIAYLVPNWHEMELIFSLPLILLLVTYWILPESPRYANN